LNVEREINDDWHECVDPGEAEMPFGVVVDEMLEILDVAVSLLVGSYDD
jgi:hypothetical protein